MLEQMPWTRQGPRFLTATEGLRVERLMEWVSRVLETGGDTRHAL